MPTIVIDPGNGGKRGATAADGNAAATLDLAGRIRHAIEKAQTDGGVQTAEGRCTVRLTHEGGNPSSAERASVARRCGAALFLSLGFNRLDGSARGTAAWIDRKYRSAYWQEVGGSMEAVEEGPGDPDGEIRNLNHVEDALFAAAMARACYEAIRSHDEGARLLSTSYDAPRFGEDYRPPPGVGMKALAVLDDAVLGTMANDCRACLLEVDFIDNPAVHALFNGPHGGAFRDRLAGAIGRALIDAAGPRRRRRIPPE